jgi:catechol 2,3-dioxygenase-like lactoylglutathione lyase family enzyme
LPRQSAVVEVLMNDVPQITGIHHVKFPVTDLERSRRWYERVLGLQVLVDFPDEDGTVRGLAGLLAGTDPPVAVALREHAKAANGVTGFDPVSFAIADRAAADAWVDHLDALGVQHSPVIDGTLGWALDFPDPDGTVLRLYSTERHGLDQTGRPGHARPVPVEAGQ